MGPESALWYVMIGEQETGPLTRVELGVELASGSITPNTLVWKEGMIKWLPGARVPELEALFKNPPRSPRTTGSRPPPPPKQTDKAMGLADFDTAHFRLADAQAVDDAAAASRQMEFDTSHFRLQDLKGAQGARALVPKRIVPKGMEAPEIEIPQPAPSPGRPGRTALKQASTSARPPPASPAAARHNPPPVATPPPAAKAAPKQAAILSKGTSRPAGKPAAAEEPFDPNQTSVDFRTLGALVQKQNAAQSLFESELVPDEAPVIDEPPPPDPHVEQLSKWAAGEIENSAKDEAHPAAPKKKAAPPPPVPHAPREEKSWVPTAIAIAGALLLVFALAWYFIAD